MFVRHNVSRGAGIPRHVPGQALPRPFRTRAAGRRGEGTRARKASRRRHAPHPGAQVVRAPGGMPGGGAATRWSAPIALVRPSRVQVTVTPRPVGAKSLAPGARKGCSRWAARAVGARPRAPVVADTAPAPPAGPASRGRDRRPVPSVRRVPEVRRVRAMCRLPFRSGNDRGSLPGCRYGPAPSRVSHAFPIVRAAGAHLSRESPRAGSTGRAHAEGPHPEGVRAFGPGATARSRAAQRALSSGRRPASRAARPAPRPTPAHRRCRRPRRSTNRRTRPERRPRHPRQRPGRPPRGT